MTLPAAFDRRYAEAFASTGLLVARSVVRELGWKAPVQVATTANVDITTDLAAGQVVDGVTLVAGWRVLVPAQTSAAENGIRVVPATGAAPRAADFDDSVEIVGAVVPVLAGTLNAGLAFRNTNTGPVVVDTDPITFTAAAVRTLDDVPDVDADSPQDGDGLIWDAAGGAWVNRPAARHVHVVGEPFVGDGSQTVFYLANDAEEGTVAAYDVNGARVAITQDATELDKITFAAAPAAGQGFIDYILATG